MPTVTVTTNVVASDKQKGRLIEEATTIFADAIEVRATHSLT